MAGQSASEREVGRDQPDGKLACSRTLSWFVAAATSTSTARFAVTSSAVGDLECSRIGYRCRHSTPKNHCPNMTPKRVLVRQLNSRRHGMARLLCGPWMPPQGSFQAQDAARIGVCDHLKDLRSPTRSCVVAALCASGVVRLVVAINGAGHPAKQRVWTYALAVIHVRRHAVPT